MAQSIIPQKTPLDRALDTLSLIGLIAIWILTTYIYQQLPDRVPTHYDFSGHIDRYGGPGFIWLFPILSSALYALLTFINRHPEWFNVPVKLTPDNKSVQLALATQLIRWLKCVLILFFNYFVVETAYNATHVGTFAGGLDVLVFVALIFCLIGVYIVKMRRRA